MYGIIFFGALAFLSGVGIGFFYFGGLWWTVRRLPHTARPTLLSMGSFIPRVLVTLTALYFVMSGEAWRLVVCLIGFTVARIGLIRRLRPVPADRPVRRS
jgi:F1F0 ATPase subunit 2